MRLSNGQTAASSCILGDLLALTERTWLLVLVVATTLPRLSSRGRMKSRNMMPATLNHPISLKWCGKPQHKSDVHCKCATAFSLPASGRQVTTFASTTLKATSLENLLKMSRLDCLIIITSSFFFSVPCPLHIFFAPSFFFARHIWNETVDITIQTFTCEFVETKVKTNFGA